jgi:hypothetical protein
MANGDVEYSDQSSAEYLSSTDHCNNEIETDHEQW